jgi:hypothetical protein
MALVNRDKDQSEQREFVTAVIDRTASGVSAGIMNPVVATGITYPFANVPYPASLVAIDQVTYGTSGAPAHSVWCYRFAGGFTAFPVGTTIAATNFGTSGIQGYTLIAGSAATLPLLAGDQLVLYTQGANTAAATVQVTAVLKALQDIKTHFGV